MSRAFYRLTRKSTTPDLDGVGVSIFSDFFPPCMSKPLPFSTGVSRSGGVFARDDLEGRAGEVLRSGADPLHEQGGREEGSGEYSRRGGAGYLRTCYIIMRRLCVDFWQGFCSGVIGMFLWRGRVVGVTVFCK